MTTDDVIEVLGGWKGYSIERIEAGNEKGRAQVWIDLMPLPEIARQCSGCKRMVHQIHDVTFRWVRDLSILGAVNLALVGTGAVACPHCGPKLEALDWLAPYSRLTRRLAENVVRLCRVLPIKHVAEYLNLTWDTVKATDNACFQIATSSIAPIKPLPQSRPMAAKNELAAVNDCGTRAWISFLHAVDICRNRGATACQGNVVPVGVVKDGSRAVNYVREKIAHGIREGSLPAIAATSYHKS